MPDTSVGAFLSDPKNSGMLYTDWLKKQQGAVPAPATATTTAPVATAAPSLPTANVPTPKFEQGNPYNEILYSKNQWEAPGANDGAKAWAEQNAQQYYAQLSPDEASKVRDMNASQLEAYMPKPPTAQPTPQQYAAPTIPTSSVPTPSTPYTTTQDQIRAEAQARIAKQRAALEQGVNATKAGLKNTFDYNNQITNDRRTLENQAFGRSNSPFSGRTDYLAADLARTRSIQDTASNRDYASAVSAADQKLADFDTQAPEQTDALFNELQRIERDYGLQVGQLTGNFGGQRTLAGQQFDWQRDPNNPAYQGEMLQNQGQAITNQMNQIKLSNLPNEIKQQADLFAQQFERGQLDLQTAQFNLQQLMDPGSPVNVAKTLDNQMRQLELQYMPQEQRLKLQQLQKQIEQIGKAPYRSKQDVEMDKVKLATMQEQLRQLQEGGSSSDEKAFVDNLRTLYTAKDPGTNEMRITNPQALRSAIIGKYYPDENKIDKMLLMFGLQPN